MYGPIWTNYFEKSFIPILGNERPVHNNNYILDRAGEMFQRIVSYDPKVITNDKYDLVALKKWEVHLQEHREKERPNSNTLEIADEEVGNVVEKETIFKEKKRKRVCFVTEVITQL
ncbi:hypothetical protein QE152_g36615 [Popillia japonica]|uniref:Potassium channel tetramerisation-type BTB domain-containing protein n=1 Tax=Popillia japonica TaxID=7064 RepID=A0AAW1ICK4_POPJA